MKKYFAPEGSLLPIKQFLITFLVFLWVIFTQAADYSYTGSTNILANPDRGILYHYRPLDFDNTTRFLFQNTSYLTGLRDQGITVVQNYYKLNDFTNSAISAAYLSNLQTDYDLVRSMGLKLAPRFTYNWIAPVTNDAPLSVTLGHLDQLAPVFAANKDVTSYLDAGFIGRYGEMHTSTQGYIDPGQVILNPSGVQIAQKILDVTPTDRMWAIRYPDQLSQLFATPLDASQAYDGSNIAQSGFANDGFLLDDSHFGTFVEPGVDPVRYAAQRAYVEASTQFTVSKVELGGYVSGYDPAYINDGARALAEMDAFNISLLTPNISDGGDTILATWDSQGLLDDVINRLGYRFRLISASIPTVAGQGQSFSLSLEMANDGVARPFNPRDMDIVLRNVTSLQEYSFNVAVGDTRLFLPGAGETKNLNLSFNLPSGIPLGDYDLFLNLADPEASLNGNADYSIQLANTGLWEGATGYNSLNASLTIQPVPEPSTYGLFVIAGIVLLSCTYHKIGGRKLQRGEK